MLDAISIITLKPEFKKISSALIEGYIELCYQRFTGYSDNLIQLAVFHFLEIERTNGQIVVERTGDQDTIKFQPLQVNSFWDLSQYGKMFQQFAKASSSFRHIRP